MVYKIKIMRQMDHWKRDLAVVVKLTSKFESPNRTKSSFGHLIGTVHRVHLSLVVNQTTRELDA